MRLQASIDVTIPGEGVTREPTVWERAKRAFGGKLDLSTDKVRVALEAAAVVERVRAALAAMGIDNAVSLVIDDQVIYSGELAEQAKEALAAVDDPTTLAAEERAALTALQDWLSMANEARVSFVVDPTAVAPADPPAPPGTPAL